MISHALKQFRYFIKSHLLWVLLPIQSGPLKGFRWSLFTGIRFIRGDYHLTEAREMAKLVHAGDVVYDIGAHVGYYSLIFSQACGEQKGKVFAFEPLPVNLKSLRVHLNANKIKNVSILPYAASSEAGVLRFDTAGGTGRGRISHKGKVVINTITLDELVFEKDYPVPDFIKIDVEGAEVHVLKGASKLLDAYSPKIFLATHGDAIRLECEKLLRQNGYELQPFRNADIIAEKKSA